MYAFTAFFFFCCLKLFFLFSFLDLCPTAIARLSTTIQRWVRLGSFLPADSVVFGSITVKRDCVFFSYFIIIMHLFLWVNTGTL